MNGAQLLRLATVLMTGPPARGQYLPKIYALNRSDVVTIEYGVSQIAAGPKSP